MVLRTLCFLTVSTVVSLTAARIPSVSSRCFFRISGIHCPIFCAPIAYSDKNGTTNGGFIAIRLMNALSTGGFQLKTADKNKGQMAFEYTAHYSMSKQDVVPYEVYIKAGTAET